CTAVAPELFEMNDDGKAQEKKPSELTDQEKDKAKEAVEICPVQAIKINE
ncbi:ferredoxin, partial [Candidatus Woesearchaeota archaeon]|nr:ferredoxin [Candidatus Woesearchaeota archaeon]